MSGHSKWSTIKHKKGKEDAKRGKLFSKLSRYITVAAREGGGSLDMNAALAAAVSKAKDFSMPADNIDRAIKRGTGEIAGAAYEQITYEGYGPDGVAVIVEVMTDNRNRTAADMRHAFAKYNGNLGTAGSVSWMFDRKGVILAAKQELTEDKVFEMAIEAGAEDINNEEDQYEIVTEPAELMEVKSRLEGMGLPLTSAELSMLPKNPTPLDKEQAKRVLRLLDVLEDNDDVQEVYANFDISDDIMEELAKEG